MRGEGDGVKFVKRSWFNQTANIYFWWKPLFSVMIIITIKYEQLGVRLGAWSFCVWQFRVIHWWKRMTTKNTKSITLLVRLFLAVPRQRVCSDQLVVKIYRIVYLCGLSVFAYDGNNTKIHENEIPVFRWLLVTLVENIFSSWSCKCKSVKADCLCCHQDFSGVIIPRTCRDWELLKRQLTRRCLKIMPVSLKRVALFGIYWCRMMHIF